MLAVIAKIKAKAGQEAEFEAAAKQLVAAVNANEPGCKLYALHKADEPQVYYMIERYDDAAAIDAHRAAVHFKELGGAMGRYMDGRPEVLRLEHIAG